MITFNRTFVLLASILTTRAEFDEYGPDIPIDPSIPVECYGPPDHIDLQECCPVKPLFPDKDFEECGFPKPDGSKPWRSRDCSPRICIFKKFDLLYENGTLNYEAISNHLDKWGEDQPNIAEGVREAKSICLWKKAGPPVPQKPFAIHYFVPCEIDRLLICLRSNVIWNCEHNLRAAGCKKLSNHMKKCKQYLYKEIPTE